MANNKKKVVLYEVITNVSDNSIIKKTPMLNSKKMPTVSKSKEHTKFKKVSQTKINFNSTKTRIIILILVFLVFFILIYLINTFTNRSSDPIGFIW